MSGPDRTDRVWWPNLRWRVTCPDCPAPHVPLARALYGPTAREVTREHNERHGHHAEFTEEDQCPPTR